MAANKEFIKQKIQQGNDVKIPPRENVLAAADHIRNLFEKKKFAYGVMGGLEMLCLGYRRDISDLHIAYDDRDFNRIKAKLGADKRAQLPDGMNSLFPAKVLVRTGPAYKDAECINAATIEVNLIPPGSYGTPSSGMISANLVLLSLKDAKLKTYKCLNMLHLVKTLVHLCRVRDLAWDPRKDILFLCQHYGEEVQSIRAQLNQKEVQENFLGTPFVSQLSSEDQRKCYQILLGKDPPPVMAVIPPPPSDGHKHSHSASEIPRPRMNSQNSSPELLSPPLPGKPNSSRQQATKTKSQSIDLTASPKPPPALPVTGRDSRSRYRPISVPNSRNNSPKSSPLVNSLRPKSMDMRHLPQPGSSQNTHHMSAQNVANTKEKFVSNLAPTSMVDSVRRSMPDLNVGFSDPVVPVASSQPFVANATGTNQSPQQLFSTLPVEMLATPATYKSGQKHLKPQLGLGGDNSLPNLRAEKRTLTTADSILPNARVTYQGPQKAKLEPSGTPKPQSQVGSLHMVNPKEEAALLQQYVPNLEEVASKLHLVGSEGLYEAPLKSTLPTEPSLRNAPQQASHVFELDATPPQKGTVIGELSADSDAALQENSSLPSEQMQPNIYNRPITDELLFSLPDSHTSTASIPHQQRSYRPSNPRTQSAPFTALPTSLKVGGLGAPRPHSRTPSNSISYTPSQTASSQLPATKTNASRYSQYYSPPSSEPNSEHSSPQPSPALPSLYKAYSPPSIPLQSLKAQQARTEHLERQARSRNVDTVQGVDGAQSYFRMHKRDASHDSQASTASHDSSKLAREYQVELPDFDRGYNSRDEVVDA
ncbi:uncharacterized protein K460DRAFT_371231 [Cucurbitaria berberidis CBS 394.84]|uniref:Uncharacterized protein n=1 Tax=Cucurbitaria berberidis CBS 394.84 TaxID=1168544 RepID=A0A9P4L491_9PLEO|nr:uncharacterized protein K460DRAFT_371231 [Cucurbitaria berberidis CBS 394.84]KAF1841220.1 hypothetical protein K460DRAFT_371231 [Cucurbitaria berberidis CBS 394.84]